MFYSKINSIYKRDDSGNFTSDYSLKEFEYLSDLKWEATEKVDGTNIRIYWNGKKVEFGGRTERSVLPAHLLLHLNELFTDEKMQEAFQDREVILFGEGYGSNIQAVGPLYSADPKFILFDAVFGRNYAKRESLEGISDQLNCDIVPVVDYFTFEEAIDFVRSNPRSLLGDLEMEGVMLRPQVRLCDQRGRRIIAKVKCKDFKG